MLVFHSVLWNSCTNVNQLSDIVNPSTQKLGLPVWMMFLSFQPASTIEAKKAGEHFPCLPWGQDVGTCSRFHQPYACAPDVASQASDAQKWRPQEPALVEQCWQQGI